MPRIRKTLADAKKVNQYLLANPNVTNFKKLLQQKPEFGDVLHNQQVPQTSNILAVYPIRPGLADRLVTISSHWPDPRSEHIPVTDAFRATAPQPILDQAGITASTAPPPEILVLNNGSEPQPGMFEGLMFQATDLEGIRWVQVTSRLENLNEAGFPISNSQGEYVYTDWSRTQHTLHPPYPRTITQWISHPVNYGQLETEIIVRNKSDREARIRPIFGASGPVKPAPPPPPPPPQPQYEPEVEAFARQNNLARIDVKKLYDGGNALQSGDWSLTWYGSIEVVLSSSQCGDVAKAAEAISTVIAAVGMGDTLGLWPPLPWYVILILGLIALMAAEIASVLATHQKRGETGTLGFNILTGIFYAA